RLIEHQEKEPTIAFVKEQMVGGIGMYRLIRVRFEEDRTDIVGDFRRWSYSFSMTAADPYATEQAYRYDTHHPDRDRHHSPPQQGCQCLGMSRPTPSPHRSHASPTRVMLRRTCHDSKYPTRDIRGEGRTNSKLRVHESTTFLME